MKKLVLSFKNKIISIFLVIILSIVIIGCNDETLMTENSYLSQENNRLKKELKDTQQQFESLSESQAKKLFELAELHNSIKADEFFFARKC